MQPAAGPPPTGGRARERAPSRGGRDAAGTRRPARGSGAARRRAPRGCCSIRPRSPTGASGPRRAPSSTGWRWPASAGGRCCRSDRRTSTAPRTRLARPSPRPPRCSSIPDAAVSDEEIAAFRVRHAFWADGWERFAGPGALADQVRFAREWSALRAYATARGVRLLGDVPLYVAPRSADVESWPTLFTDGEIAGAPPDDYSAVGQLWGNPLHDWRAHAADGYRWWVERIGRTLELVDAARIDHFRGLVSYWAVPAGAPDAVSGRWRRGPGGAPLRAAAGAVRSARADRRGSRADHAGRRGASGPTRAPRDARAPVRLLRRAREPAPPGEPRPRRRRLHRDARQPDHPRVVGGDRRRRASRGRGRGRGRRGRRGAAASAARPAGPRLARGALDRPRAGPPRARRRGEVQHPGDRRRELGVAARTGCARRSPRGLAAGRHRGGGPDRPG